MAYVPVPKDLTKVKTKVMFNLTKRQLICFTGGALIGVPLFLLLRKPTGNSVAAMCMMLVMLPFFTPEVEYHNIVAQPTEHQQEMVKALSERASLVHSGTVDPSQDNMLKITSDGRKLGLDQRIVNQMLPDEPGTKVNQCVDNIMQIWRDGKADRKSTRLNSSHT